MASVGDLLHIAQGYLGVPYVYGGTTPKGFDCSGFVKYVFGKVGIKLPRTSQEQAFYGEKISPADLSPGDLIFSDWGDGMFSHVAIYAGGGKLIESPRTGKSVQLAPFDANYKAHTDAYRRVTSKKTGQISIVTPISAAAGGGGGGISGGGTADGGSGGGLLSWPGAIISFFADGAQGLEASLKFFSAFFQPSTYVRIGAGLIGLSFLGAGMVFLILGAM